MIRKLMFTIVWGYAVCFAAMPFIALIGPRIAEKMAGSETPEQADVIAARMLRGVPGVCGFIGVAFGLAGLLPGTSLRKKVFRPSSRGVFRKLDPVIFALWQFLDGDRDSSAMMAEERPSDLPKVALLTVGIISILLGAIGLLYGLLDGIKTAVHSDVPEAVTNVLVFHIAFYAMLAVCAAFCGGLLVCGVEFVRLWPGKVRRFGYLLMVEVLYFVLMGFLVRVLYWQVPEVGVSVGAAMDASSSALMFQAIVLFPLWAPFVALWAMYQLEAQKAASTGAGRQGTPIVDKAEAVKILLTRHQVVCKMFHGFDYAVMLAAPADMRKAGIAQAVKFIQNSLDGQSRYMRATAELSRAFDRALPAYKAAVLRDEIQFFQEVRAAMLRPAGQVMQAQLIPDDADDAPEAIPAAAILEPVEPAAPRYSAGRTAPCDDEFSFYDAVAADDPEVAAMKEDTLRDIVQDLSRAVRRDVTADWAVRKNAKAELRMLVKKILKKYSYPPRRHEQVVQAVLGQAEEFCKDLGSARH